MLSCELKLTQNNKQIIINIVTVSQCKNQITVFLLRAYVITAAYSGGKYWEQHTNYSNNHNKAVAIID